MKFVCIGLCFYISFFVLYRTITFLLKFFGFSIGKKIKHFKDDQERIITYRGVNICNYSKWDPEHLPWHTEKEYSDLKKWGFNIVRFLVYWEAIEPEKGVYNETYINKVIEHFNMLEKLDIKVIVDVHQDLYNKKFQGNGFPDWTLPRKTYSFKPQKEWYMNYFQEAVFKSYKRFWGDEELKNKYIEMLLYLQDKIKNVPNVLGIDVMNEPFPTFPFVWNFESKILSEFYSQIYLTSLVNDFKKTLFFEPCILNSTGLPSYLKLQYSGDSAQLIPHYYPPFCRDKGKYNFINKWLMKIAIRSKAKEAQNLNIPFIIGEFGISPSIKNHINCIHDFISLSEKYTMNWIWWSYDLNLHSNHGLLDILGQPNMLLSNLVNIYPQKIAGKNPKYYNKKNTFNLEYEIDDKTNGNTEIFIPPWFSYEITTECKFSVYDNIITIYNTADKKQKIEITYR